MEERVERRLAAILCADIVGYSRLMGADEEGTLSSLKTHRRELIDPLIATHQGRIVKTTGDGFLIEFASVVDAVRFAVVLVQGMTDRNADVPEDRRMRFRVGINLGDIIVDDNDIFGDGVNVAARLEALAEPGEIYVSSSVREQVGEKLPICFIDRGEHHVKNIARPVRVYRIDSTRPDGVPQATQPVVAASVRPSIAVLPFTNMTAGDEQEYFTDGIVEDIISGLSRIKWLLVIARNTSFIYKGKAVDVKQVGRELRVRYVLEGSVRKAGNRVRITAQLIDAETGAHVWADRYDRSLDDIFAVQDEITLSTVGAIEPSLREAEIERVKRKRPENLDAYDLLLRALPHTYAAMPAEARVAVPLLERALTLEPDYGLAHAYLAWCREVLFVREGFKVEDRSAALRHARAAIEHGRDDANALALGAFVIAMVEHDRVTATDMLEAALALSPSCSLALLLGAAGLAWGGDAKRALEWGERGIRLSPHDRLAFGAYHSLAIGHLLQGRHDEAANAARRAIQSNPGFSLSHMLLAVALAKLDRLAEAKEAVSRVLALQPNFTIRGFCEGLAVPESLASILIEGCDAAGLPN
jgi:adenylate cyclase